MSRINTLAAKFEKKLEGLLADEINKQDQEGQSEKALEVYRSSISPTDVQVEIFRTNINKFKFGIYNKGRRLGATRGAAEAFIEYILEGKTCLWVDVVQGNIRRYFDEYFEKVLKKAGFKEIKSNQEPGAFDYQFNKQDLILKIGAAGGKCDFRSADYPDRIEGFGYDIIFFNEAGLILNDSYLWKNAVMPMMADNENSVAIVAGTPKLTLGKGAFFQKLAERRDSGRDGYGGRRISSYENPHLSGVALEILKQELKDEGYRGSAGEEQELEGKFVDLKNLGDFFRMDWFQTTKPKPISRILRGWDLAATPVSDLNKDPDFTYSCGVDVHNAGLTIYDTDFLRGSPVEVNNHMKMKLRQDLKLCRSITYVIPEDPAAAGKTAFEHHKQLLLSEFELWQNEPLGKSQKLERKNTYTFNVIAYKQGSNKGSKINAATPAASLAEKQEIDYIKTMRSDHFFFQLAVFPSPEHHDDACFVAGTKIQTDSGMKPIEVVTPNDMALTREGYKPIEAAFCTSKNARVIRAVFDNGAELIGTPNHPIFTLNRGFVRLDALTNSDKIYVCQNMSLSPTKRLNTTDTRNQKGVVIGFTSQTFMQLVKAMNITTIGKFIKTIMEIFQKAFMFTIKTATPSIMNLATCKPYHQVITMSYTKHTYAQSVQNNSSILRRLGRSLKHGIGQMRGKSGTGNTVKTCGKPKLRKTVFVSSVAECLKLIGLSGQSIAQKNVSQRGEGKRTRIPASNAAKTSVDPKAVEVKACSVRGSAITIQEGSLKLTLANGAVRPSSDHQTSMCHHLNTVQLSAIETISQTQAVYNLKVKNIPEYFANGILVHNCDSLSAVINNLHTKPDEKSAGGWTL